MVFAVLAILSGSALCQQPNRIVSASDRPVPADFSIASAMLSLYGNVGPVTQNPTGQNSLWTVASDSASDPDGNFVPGTTVMVKPFFTATAVDGGVEKVFLLTYAILRKTNPKTAKVMFGCHACAPLIGMATFVRGEGGWKRESLGRDVTLYGQFGGPPDAKLVQIGQNRMGVELSMIYGGQDEFTDTVSLLVPWAGKVTRAFFATTSDRFDGCETGSSVPCYSYSRKLEFVPGENPDYFDILLILSGTEVTDSEPIRKIPVTGTERWRFSQGKYTRVSRTDGKPSEERK